MLAGRQCMSDTYSDATWVIWVKYCVYDDSRIPLLHVDLWAAWRGGRPASLHCYACGVVSHTWEAQSVNIACHSSSWSRCVCMI